MGERVQSEEGMPLLSLLVSEAMLRLLRQVSLSSKMRQLQSLLVAKLVQRQFGCFI